MFGEKFANFNEFYNRYERTKQLWYIIGYSCTQPMLAYCRAVVVRPAVDGIGPWYGILRQRG